MHINNLLSLKGKVAIVVGGAGKIGFPISEALAEAGAIVYIASRNQKSYKKAVEKLSKKGYLVNGINLNMADENSAKNALNKIKNENKIPDILVNSACIRPMKKFMDDTIDNWDLSMQTNARGAFIVNRLFGNEMAKQHSGSIINISSIYGISAPDMAIYEGSNFETEPDYPFVKGGLIMLSKYFASYYAKKNVRVNVIAPGGLFNNQPEPFLTKYNNKVPMGRMAEEDDIKGPALFLASDLSSYVTGVVIPVDGGWTSI
jgi:NAD(P)-dependent dehydrogenase (short-subunit alcohol dehydrogenase family)